jgi:CubicO group peptidase (beta-lactamase class C family)
VNVTPQIQGSVLVARDNTIVYEASGGLADVAAGTPCAADTRFQIASVSKQFTAAATLLLVEEGSVGLDQSIDRWIGGSPPSWRDITVHHLLTHTSGLGHWHDYPDLDLTSWVPPDEALTAFQKADPLFPPGTGWHYSSPGYVLLARIVEQTGDEPYRDFLAGRVFQPVGLHDTYVGMPAGHPRTAVGYDGSDPVPSFELNSLGMGAGDVSSTTHDLLRWDRALAAGAFLTDRSRQLTFTPHAAVAADRPGDAYGYGWELGPVSGRAAARYHSGGNSGFRAYNLWFPDEAGYVLVLSNNDEVDSREVATNLADLLLR